MNDTPTTTGRTGLEITPGGDAVVVLTTVSSAEAARAMVRTLVNEQLAACGNIVDSATSIYSWQGRLCEEAETLVILKTARERLEPLGRRIRELHDYDVPELLALDVAAGSKAYLDWLIRGTRPSDAAGTAQ